MYIPKLPQNNRLAVEITYTLAPINVHWAMLFALLPEKIKRVQTVRNLHPLV